MAGFSYNAAQLIGGNEDAILNDAIRCPHGYVMHRPGSGIVTLMGETGNCNRFARYSVRATGNIAIPEGGTPGPIAVAIAVNGEVVPVSKASVVPAAAGDYWHFCCDYEIDVRKGCCVSFTVRNVLPPNAAVGATVQPIEMQNLYVQVDRKA